VIVCSGEMTDDMPRSTGSVICSDTSAGIFCVWGSDGRGEHVTRIREAGRGGEDGTVPCRFGWVLVLFGPFLLGGA